MCQQTRSPLRVLVATRLFPNAVNEHYATFNRQQFLALSKLCTVRLLALIPWFPGARYFGGKSEAARFQSVPAYEKIEGLDVQHPRAFYIPRFAQRVNPITFAVSLLPAVLPLRHEVDVILGSWAYPDGLAALHLGRWLGLPVVVKVHGTDLNSLPKRNGIRWTLSRGLRNADRLVAVSRPLGLKAQEFGVPPERIAFVPNGVDRTLFTPRDQLEARSLLGLPAGRLVLYVGRLEPMKGVLDLLQAFERIAACSSDIHLGIVGDGSEMPRCQAVQRRWPGRIFLPGAQPLAQVARWITASDVVTLPSWNEGTPNVILEALACGRRVVASKVGGIPDLLTSDLLGELVSPRSPEELTNVLLRAARSSYDAMKIAQAGPGDWTQSALLLRQVLESAYTSEPLPQELLAHAAN